LGIHLQMLVFFGWFLIVASAIGCVYLWYACHAVERFSRRRVPTAAQRLPVTVLKPLRGEDSALAENLRSFCRQNYAPFQIVFGVADADDAAVPVVRALISEFPTLDLTLVIDPRRDGANFKIANLRNMLRAARHPLLIIADSDMRVGPDYLAAVTAPLAESGAASSATGLVTCLYRGLSSGGLWSDLASLHINHGFLPQALVAERLGMGAGCFGATMALTRSTLDAAGSLDALANTLADDHALGQAVRRLGLKVELSPYLVDDIVAEASFLGLFRHELRWARTIRLVAPSGFLGSAITYPVPFALLATALGALPLAAPALLALALLSRLVTGWRIDRALGVKRSTWWLLPLRDLLSFAVFIASFFGRRVAWRGGKFRIGRSGQLIIDGPSHL
jgi:ceramide glucosyltransferase